MDVPMQMTSPRSWSRTPSPSRLWPHLRTIFARVSSKGSPKPTWETTPPSKKVNGLIPLVRSMT